MNLSKTILILCFSLFVGAELFAQGVIKGTVKDELTGETIVGAAVTYGENKGAATDIDGNFKFDVPNGEYTITVTYVGFSQKTKKITINNNTVYTDFALATKQLTEVEIVSDIAIARKTPVAFSNLSPLKIQEELGSNDLPMLLNTTPGVYATQGGGGDGDSRISIRGFSQQNVAVMIDGVPMNDMENGQVYWSNWFGLDNLTKGVQVQRGLGASKLAIPSVGGSMNILTAGIENKKQIVIKQEYSHLGNVFETFDKYDGREKKNASNIAEETMNRNGQRTVISYSSGRLNKGWGATGALSFKKSDGWVDGLYSSALFYFVKVDKLMGAHSLSASAFGAPQQHGQRFYKQQISVYSHEQALKLGADTTGFIERGMRYNPQWNYISRKNSEDNGAGASPERISSSMNYFHKPVFSVKDFWTVNDKLYMSNIAYASYGKGGGAISSGNFPTENFSGQQNFQIVYDNNSKDTSYTNPTTGLKESTPSGFIVSSVNNHNWYGLLSTVSYKHSDQLEISGGVDLRTYESFRYQEVYDLLGADLLLNNADANQSSNIKRLGDKIGRNTSGFVRWGGLFAMAEYKGDKLSAFLNVSGSYSGVKQINYFVKKDLVLPDTTYIRKIGYNDTIVHNGSSYTRDSKEAIYNQTPWKWLGGYTIKGGANYNLTEKINAFVNLGYLNKAPLIANVIKSNNTFFDQILNEKIKAVELGAAYSSRPFKVNLNTYYTVWQNRPTRLNLTDGNNSPVSVNAIGLGARHMGAELDFAYKIDEKLTWEGMVSIGDWIWNSKAQANIEDQAGNIIDSLTIYIDPRGIKVGNAAQHSFGSSIRWEPIKKLYFKPQFTYFTHNYADFDPGALEIKRGAKEALNAGRQSWRMPNYGILDFNTGYGFQFDKWKLDIRASVNNVLNTFYIADAQNNGMGIQTFDANSATVYIGLGRRITFSLTATF
ncbi:MAG: TonB-dependent receptor [Bacteroidota bacterium]